MTDSPCTFLYLAGGGGGGEGDLAAFAKGLDVKLHFETVPYPGWQRYVDEEFSAESLIDHLTEETLRRAPEGPIRLMGMSIGGHFGYAVALRLQQMGREVALFCAIDSFLVSSAEPVAGWQRRALVDALDMLRKGRFADFARFVRSKVWRAVLRLAGDGLTGLMRRLSDSGRLPKMFRSEGVAEQELSMRLLIRKTAPWCAQLDRDPLPMTAPTMLLRTQESACYDDPWTERCPRIAIREVPGRHQTLFEPENIAGLREAFTGAADELGALPRPSLPQRS